MKTEADTKEDPLALIELIKFCSCEPVAKTVQI